MQLARPLPERLADAVPRLGGWSQALRDWQRSAVGAACIAEIERRRRAGVAIHPDDVLRALTATPLERARVVIVGQDPYHGPDQADGLAFSVPPGVRRPPSLRNIDAELERDLGLVQPEHGDLGAWAARGVLLLNRSLTVEEGAAASHARLGWLPLTEALVRLAAADVDRPKAFMLWGAHAQALRPLIEAADPAGRHLIVASNHPSPLSARRPPVPFIGSGQFGRVARWLDEVGGGERWTWARG